MDYFMADADGNTLWYVRNFGNGLLANPVAFAEIPWINHLMITDHDGDGDLDILFVSESSIGWLENIDGVISATPQMLTSSQYFALSAVHFDVNNDGAKDVIMSITATNEIALYQKEGSVDYQSAQVINSTLQDVNWLTAMDVNNDGFEDLMLISAYSLKWLPNLGNGTFGPANTLATPGMDVTVVIAADVNGDGIKDIVIASNARNIYTMLNQGNGVFQTPVQLNISSLYSPQELICDDSDLDGDLDLYAFSDWKDSGYWFENTGGGTFAQPVTIHTANEPNTYSMAHALIEDMDGDGDKDIIVSNGDLDMYWLKNHHFHAGQVKGRTFVDRNANGIHDSTDTGIPMHNMISNPQSDFTFTNSDGKYFMIFSDVSGTYQISPQPIPYWGLSTDSTSYQVTLNTSTAPLDSLDFGFVPDTIIHQLEPKIIGGFPRCNTTINYWLDVRNSGTTIPSGVIRLELDTNLTYVASVQIPDSITGNYIYWHFDSLSYFNAEQWKLSVQVPDFQSMGAVMTSRLTAYVYDSTGALSVSFTDSIRQTVVCAYDPNDKIIEPAGYGPLGLIAMETSSLDYTVRFQNTGNDTAITVRILDQLDPSLRWRSLEILASSDPVTVNGNQDGSVIFEFKNIFLPDSNINELASHGFIHYRLHLEENLPAGTQIRNFASIFFDLNPAVITNETVNTLYECPAGPIQYTFSSPYACSRDFSGTVIAPELNKEYTWTINGTQHTGTAFNWTADIAGTYNLQLTATDSLEICAVKYTTQTVTITDGVIGVELQEFAQDTICLQSNAVSLPAGIPSGGTYTGTGIAGNTFDPAIAGNGTHSIVYTYTDENDCTSSDTASITVQICLGIYELSAKDINVFPNPFKGTTSIQFPQDPGGEYDLVIYNLLGETVSAKQMVTENPQVIGLHGMEPGVYLLNLIHRSSGSRIIKPLILE